MNPKTIKQIDKYIGQPICLVLTLFRLVIKIFFASKNDKPSRIIFIKLIEQGATVLAYSAIKRAIDMVGRENVYFCVFEDNRPILDILNIIPAENILIIRQNNFIVFCLDILKFLLKVRKEKINITIDMEFFSRASAIIAYISGAVIRVGLHRFTSELPYRGDLMTHRIQYNPYIHTSKAYLLLVEALTMDNNEIPLLKIPVNDIQVDIPKFIPTDEEKKKVQDLLADKLGREIKYPVVLLNPNASDMLPLRKWSTERFIELGKKLLIEHQEATLVITGATSEKNVSDEICNEIGNSNIVSVAGETSLRELIILYTIADVLITNDSGPGHFASMTEIQLIVMFGPETPELFGPLGDNVHTIWKELACSPCVNAFNHRFSPCDNNVCMQTISVEEVYKKVVNCLSNR